MRILAAAALLVALFGCAPREPPNWPEGGAALAIPEARWDRGTAPPIEIRADGRVLEDGRLLFVIDRVGRVVDRYYDPVAILLPDGRLIGTDDRFLGQVGVTNAAPPWGTHAWLSVLPDRLVMGFDDDGERISLGRWRGCRGPALRSCTLVSHLALLRSYRPPPNTGVSVGIGIGIGF